MTPFRVGSAIVMGIILTAAGIAFDTSWCAVFILPGRTFNHMLGYDLGPPELGVVYGLLFNIIALSGAGIALMSGVGASITRRRNSIARAHETEPRLSKNIDR